MTILKRVSYNNLCKIRLTYKCIALYLVMKGLNGNESKNELPSIYNMADSIKAPTLVLWGDSDQVSNRVWVLLEQRTLFLYNCPDLSSVWCHHSWKIAQEFSSCGGRELRSRHNFGSAKEVFQACLQIHQWSDQ